MGGGEGLSLSGLEGAGGAQVSLGGAGGGVGCEGFPDQHPAPRPGTLPGGAGSEAELG